MPSGKCPSTKFAVETRPKPRAEKPANVALFLQGWHCANPCNLKPSGVKCINGLMLILAPFSCHRHSSQCLDSFLIYALLFLTRIDEKSCKRGSLALISRSVSSSRGDTITGRNVKRNSTIQFILVCIQATALPCCKTTYPACPNPTFQYRRGVEYSHTSPPAFICSVNLIHSAFIHSLGLSKRKSLALFPRRADTCLMRVSRFLISAPPPLPLLRQQRRNLVTGCRYTSSRVLRSHHL